MADKKLLCSASHPVDLSDGRSIGPGETATADVDNDAHNKQLVEDGALLVLADVKTLATSSTSTSTSTTTSTSPSSGGSET